MIDRRSIELAINGLDALLSDDDATESEYQAWFETHEVAFLAYGFRRSIPHPELVIDDQRFIPDFLAERSDGIWEIVELKRPDTKVLKDALRRQTFYASLEEYYAQCRDYSRTIENVGVRTRLREAYGAVLQRDITATLIAGRRQHVDLRQVHGLLLDRGAKVAFQTYDDVRTRLELLRVAMFAQSEGLKGYSIHMLIAPGKVPGRSNYIADFGVNLRSNRMSIFIDHSDNLCFRIIDNNGVQYVTQCSLTDAHIEYRRPLYLVLELGMASDRSVVCIEANGTFFVDRCIERFELDVEPLKYMVLGSDLRGKAHTEMLLCEKFVVGNTLTFHEKSTLRASMFEKYFAELEVQHPVVHFSGNQFLYSENHPNFTKR